MSRMPSDEGGNCETVRPGLETPSLAITLYVEASDRARPKYV